MTEQAAPLPKKRRRLIAAAVTLALVALGVFVCDRVLDGSPAGQEDVRRREREAFERAFEQAAAAPEGRAGPASDAGSR